MTISFVITTYNVAPYVEQCLSSVAEIAEAGDQVIIVDDGSDDGTVELIAAFADANSFAQGVEFSPIYLGSNTMGGVGIGANIGLQEATRETVFFVDGDDWIDPDGFRRARTRWTFSSCDILIANYLEFDQTKSVTKVSADHNRWHSLVHGDSPELNREQALRMIAVPWRKFYRRALLSDHNLRFPEGDFFFEDNPFHWAVCLAARTISFIDVTICYHRINRPGQTMASKGDELAAFFVHFQTIRSSLPPGNADLEVMAAQWLLNNVSWHLTRVAPAARYAYAGAAAAAFQLIDSKVWNDRLAPMERTKRVWAFADRLRAGDIGGVIDGWQRDDLESEVKRLRKELTAVRRQVDRVHKSALAISARHRFESLQSLQQK